MRGNEWLTYLAVFMFEQFSEVENILAEMGMFY